MRRSLSLVLALAIAALFVVAPAFAAGVKADVTVSITGAYSGANSLGAVNFSFDQRAYTKFVEGVGTNAAPSQADKMFSGTRTIAASGTDTLDLAGALNDPFGAAVSFAKVKAIYVKASAANTNSVVIGGASSNGFLGPFGDATDKVAVKPGGVFMMVAPAAGWPVTASTADLLQIANSGAGTGVSYDVIIIGSSS